MYGLLEIIVPSSAALAVTVLSRLAITIVEALLLGAGLLASPGLSRPSPVAADGEVDDRAEEREDDRADHPDGLLAAGDALVAEHADDRRDGQNERDGAGGGVDPVEHA